MELLHTKIHIPPVPAGLVERTALVDRLEEGFRAGCPLILLSAPPGYGKTSGFWIYLVRDLQSVQPRFGSAVLAALRRPRRRR